MAAVLLAADSHDVDALMQWFVSKDAVARWGGPRFRYPFTRETFHHDCRWQDMQTFVLREPAGTPIAFGQLYERFGRIHLARIAVKPAHRGHGIGRILVQQLLHKGAQQFELAEFALFVLKDNAPALQLYSNLGFRLAEFPDGAPMRDLCFYMTREVSPAARSR